jgi:hypothetical protein
MLNTNENTRNNCCLASAQMHPQRHEEQHSLVSTTARNRKNRKRQNKDSWQQRCVCMCALSGRQSASGRATIDTSGYRRHHCLVGGRQLCICLRRVSGAQPSAGICTQCRAGVGVRTVRVRLSAVRHLHAVCAFDTPPAHR